MRLNNNDLRQIFMSNINENTAITRKECPSPKEMLRLFRIKKLKKKKTRIIDHITNCYHCAHEFGFILKALRYEKEMNQVAEKLIATNNIKDDSPRLSWKLASAVAGISAVCIFITVLIISNAFDRPRFRGSALSTIDLILPQSKNILKSALSFRWEIVRDSEYYIFELYDETLYQIWRSDKIFENNYILPKNIVSSLEANKTYFWMISAIFPNGIKMESRLKEIFLTL